MSAPDDRLLRKDRRTVFAAWAALTAATVLARFLSPGESQSATALGDELVAAIVVLGLVKCRLVLRCFMEVRHAPRWLRFATDGWLAVLWSALLVIYLI
ncbi:prokaryotic cytochrome C oxidase subunit IV family protein [Actinomadura sp. LD22]|uniref:Prokaryotic cytochrome C oxidase subunit IV family protein n=1 Tax=Actinomadura physcomitrii TaxID=2650748 RepID=A0A6I4MHC1_9ACTN|nr:cytochrome C oxidase subunit IV family protein [Actinomadura physcomitrii]MWA05192.1 prokaryotic cytochrome C oxidase subunit IV family protein [Actinomadura physcomitrii]